jgi:hypothetical protein
MKKIFITATMAVLFASATGTALANHPPLPVSNVSPDYPPGFSSDTAPSYSGSGHYSQSQHTGFGSGGQSNGLH